MKRAKWLGVVLLLVTAISCENFLTVEEVGRSSIPKYFSDMDGIRAAVPGAYSAVYKYYDSEFLLYPDVAGDMVNLNAVGESVKMLSQFNFISTPEDEPMAVGHIWTYGYEALANVNNILEYLPQLKQKFVQHQEELEKIKGEALFLRALIHFDLVRVYAQPYNYTADASHMGIPVVLVTPGPDDNKPRNTVFETYRQIIDDLTSAEEIFRDLPLRDRYHVSLEAIQALLAKVYLNKEDWKNAMEYADKVIGKMSLSEGVDYVNMFQTLEEGKEAIFRLNGKLKKSAIAKFYSPDDPVGYASQKLIDLFDDPQDIRLQLLESDAGGSRYSTLKYSQPSISEGEKQIDIFVLRLSEIYLLRAEARLNLDLLTEATDDIKVIQARALQKNSSEITIAATTKEELAAIIQDERARELSFEGNRLFDIIRRKQSLERHSSTTSTVKTIEYPDYRFVLPLPITEVEANKNVKQNPGY